MKPLLFRLSGLAIVFASALAAPAALAQTPAPVDPLEGLRTQETGNEIFSGSGIDFNDLIHQANRAGGINAEEFNRIQQRQITNEAESFRQRRQAAIDAAASGSQPADSQQTTQP
jgi:hypothetical protein